MPLITQIEWWDRALSDNLHLQQQPGESVNDHRKKEDYTQEGDNDINNRISEINTLISRCREIEKAVRLAHIFA